MKMNFIKIFIVILIIFTLIFVSCRFNDSKINNETTSNSNEIKAITKKILDKLNVSDEKLIKDVVIAGNSYYFVYEPKKQDKRLYKYEEEQEPKLLFEYSNMKLYGNDEFLYVHYYDDYKFNAKNNVLYIKGDRVENVDNIDIGRIEFSKNNKSFAIIREPLSFSVYKKKIPYVSIGSMSMDFGKNPNPDESFGLKFSTIFSDDGEAFYAIYSLSWNKNIFYKFNLIKEEEFLENLEVYTFHKNGFYDNKNYKFNPNTGDVLYLAGLIDSEGNQDNNSKDKYLYLRNIYTNDMYMIGKINTNKIDNYTFDFNEDNQIVINGKVLKRDIKIKRNLVYTENDMKQ